MIFSIKTEKVYDFEYWADYNLSIMPELTSAAQSDHSSTQCFYTYEVEFATENEEFMFRLLWSVDNEKSINHF